MRYSSSVSSRAVRSKAVDARGGVRGEDLRELDVRVVDRRDALGADGEDAVVAQSEVHERAVVVLDDGGFAALEHAPDGFVAEFVRVHPVVAVGACGGERESLGVAVRVRVGDGCGVVVDEPHARALEAEDVDGGIRDDARDRRRFAGGHEFACGGEQAAERLVGR